ncbi:hypothetical protein [Parasitella parasitica]|uniref:RlpA-like protein double-psi beta-barrel domain-containing protein n=1 Tax=Parasitella parasitica TaxID=35722 RepID=A0A0B7NGD3_9FUNG|nr:hypothetical protein [Parasitella parasitica]
MKGILASICALALLSVSTATFPNDLYFHHHPDLVLNKNQIINKNSLSQDNLRGGQHRQSHSRPSRNLYKSNPGRKSYHNGGNGGVRPPNRAGYNNHGTHGRHEPRSVAPVQKLSYNKDGSINWNTRMAAVSDSQLDQNLRNDGQYYEQDQQQDGQPQNQYSDGYDSRNEYYDHNRNENNGNSGYYNNPSGQQFNENYGQSNSYSKGAQGIDYYQEDPQQYSNQYYGNQDNSYYYNNQNGYDDGKGYYGNDANSYNYNNNDNNNNYGNDGNSYEYGTYDSDQSQNSNKQTDSVANQQRNATAGFAGGIRLAGALPDDGYNRGEGTFYDLETRVGSCGKQSKNSEFVAAVNAEQMGQDGRNNPNCGKDIEVVGPSGKIIQVTAVDNCKTCKSGGLDLSPAAFEEIGDFSHGSVPIKWKFV